MPNLYFGYTSIRMYLWVFFFTAIPVISGQFGFQPFAYQPYGFNPYQRSPYNAYPRTPYRIAPQPQPSPYPTPSPYTVTSNNLNTLPIGMYNSFVCNKIAGIARKKRDARFQEAFGQHMNPVAVNAYEKLLPFTPKYEHEEIWQRVNYLAGQGYLPEQIVKLITHQRMYADGENGNINDIYNAMNYLSSAPNGLVEETQTRAANGICTTTNAFYCSYINKLRQSAPYCSSAALSNKLYQQCCTNQFYSQNAPSPVPSPYSAPTAPTAPTTPTLPTAPSTQDTCGISQVNPATRMGEFSKQMNQMRIVGGVNAERCEYPWMVRLRLSGAMCGGSIIDAYHILTAAHCVQSNTPATIRVNAGEYNYNQPYEPNDQSKPVAAVIKHEKYRELPNGEQENDIAVIKLAQPLQFNDCVKPICLAKKGDGLRLPSGTQCTIAGWGTTSSGGQASPVLKETTIPTYNGYECNKYFSKTVPTNRDIQLCAGRPVIGGADTCQGDSGGPLFCPVNGRYVQYGVVSYGAGCASAGAAGVYTNVGQMQDFIDRVVNSNFGK